MARRSLDPDVDCWHGMLITGAPRAKVTKLESIPHYDVDVSNESPVFTVTEVQGKAKISFVRDSQASASDFMSSVISGRPADYEETTVEVTLTVDELKRLPHDVACFTLLGEDPKPIAILGGSSDEDDNKTPDLIKKFIKSGMALVLEVKTIKDDYSADSISYIAADEWKYYAALCKKANWRQGICYGTIFVFQNAILCPPGLSKESIKRVLKNTWLAWDLVSYINNSTNLNFSEPKTLIEANLDKLFMDLEMPEHVEGTMMLNDEFRKYCLRPGIEKQKGFLNAVSKTLYRTLKEDRESLEDHLKIRDLLRTNSDGVESEFVKKYRQSVTEVCDLLTRNNDERKVVVNYCLSSILDTNWDCSLDYFNDLSNTSEGRLWEQISRSRKPCYAFLHEELTFDEICRDIELKHEEKSERFVVKAELEMRDTVHLACKGVRGKRLRNDYRKRAHESETRLPYDLSVPTADIERFVMKGIGDYLEPTTCKEPLLELMMTDFTKQSKVLSSDIEDTGLDSLFKKLVGSKLGRILRVINAVSREVNFSRFTNLKKGIEYIVKKVPGVDLLLCIVPTRSDKHIFFSMVCPKTSVEYTLPLPCRQWKDGGDLFYSEFVSVNQDKLSHILTSHEKLLSIFIQKLQTNFPSFINDLNIPQAWEQECAFSLLAFFEDKGQTSMMLQQARYAYMDLLTPPEMNSHPLKILSKIPVVLRTRLQVWVVNQFIKNFQYMYELKTTGQLKMGDMDETVKNSSGDVLQGFISWITGQDVFSVSHMLDLSYLGHLHNKDEGSLVHGYLQLFSKIAKEELALKDCDVDVLEGLKEPKEDLGKSHEFSHDSVCILADYLHKYLTNRIQTKYPPESFVKGKEIESIIDLKLKKLRFSDLATMKASAWDIESHMEYKEEDFCTNRRKVLPAIFELLECGDIDSLNVVEASVKALKILEERRKNKGVLVNLFKKQQIGGVREIFVLQFLDRLVIYVVESISRALCEVCENEMLTKGDAKVVRSDEHAKKVHVKSGEGKYQVTGISSSDATTWCQRFTMKIFGTFLFRLLPQKYHAFIARVLNCITNKKLQLPYELLKLWLKHPTINSMDVWMNEMKNQFLGTSLNKDLISHAGSRMLSNRSNFMQGILHYTSSLIHSAYLLKLTQLFSCDLIRHNYTNVLTTKCSSDDSSILMTVIGKDKEKTLEEVPVFIRRAMLFASKFYWIFGAKSSTEKSTLSVFHHVEEFNSIWLVRNTVVVPLVKFVLSAFRTPTYGKLESLSRQYSSARSQLLANGASFGLLNCIQKLQGLAHYSCLGLFSSPIGNKLFSTLSVSQSPLLGYFLAEPEMMVGLLGSDFAYYLTMKTNSKCRMVHHYYEKRGMCDINKTLEHETRLSIGKGSLARYKSAFKSMKVDRETVIEHYKDNPQKLLTFPENIADFRMELQLKSLQYDSAEVFASVKDSSSFNRGVYLTTTRVMVERQWFEESGTIEKHTLPYVVMKAMENNTENPDWKESFYLSEAYELAIKVIVEEAEKPLRFAGCKRAILTTRDLRAFEGPASVSLKDCVLSFWYNTRTASLMRRDIEIRSSWETYKRRFPWLKDSATDTLKGSPFKDLYELCLFVKACSLKRKQMCTLCSVKPSCSTDEYLRRVIKNNRWPFTSNTNKTTESRKPQFMADCNELLNIIIHCCSLPGLKTSNGSLLPDSLLERIALDDEYTDVLKTHYLRRKEVANCFKSLLVYKAVQSKKGAEKRLELYSQLKDLKLPLVIYKRKQIKNDQTNEWSGPLEMYVEFEKHRFQIFGEDNYVKTIGVETYESAVKCGQMISNILRENKLNTVGGKRDTGAPALDILRGRQVSKEDAVNIDCMPIRLFKRRIWRPVESTWVPELSFKIEPSHIKLQTVMSSRKVTLFVTDFKHMPKTHVLRTNKLETLISNLNFPQMTNDILQNFCSSSRIPIGRLERHMSALIKDRSSDGMLLRGWMMNMIEERIAFKELSPTNPLFQVLDAELEYRDDRSLDLEEIDRFLLANDSDVDSDVFEEAMEDAKIRDEELKEDPNFECLEFSALMEDYIPNDDVDVLQILELTEKKVVQTTQPFATREKPTFDSLLAPLKDMTKEEVGRLMMGKVNHDDLGLSCKILAEFMNWI